MKTCQRHGPHQNPYCVECFEDRKKVDEAGYRAGAEGKKIDQNPYEETDEQHWIWLRGWVSAGLEKHQPKTEKQPCH